MLANGEVDGLRDMLAPKMAESAKNSPRQSPPPECWRDGKSSVPSGAYKGNRHVLRFADGSRKLELKFLGRFQARKFAHLSKNNYDRS